MRSRIMAGFVRSRIMASLAPSLRGPSKNGATLASSLRGTTQTTTHASSASKTLKVSASSASETLKVSASSASEIRTFDPSYLSTLDKLSRQATKLFGEENNIPNPLFSKSLKSRANFYTELLLELALRRDKGKTPINNNPDHSSKLPEDGIATVIALALPDVVKDLVCRVLPTPPICADDFIVDAIAFAKSLPLDVQVATDVVEDLEKVKGDLEKFRERERRAALAEHNEVLDAITKEATAAANAAQIKAEEAGKRLFRDLLRP